jgi:hypothetical protein
MLLALILSSITFAGPPVVPEAESPLECAAWVDHCTCEWKCTPVADGAHLNPTCAAACPSLPNKEGCAPIDGVCTFPDPVATDTDPVWMSKDFGAPQCTRPEHHDQFPSAKSLLAELTAANVEILAQEAGVRTVCSACDCPSGEFLKVQVAPSAVEELVKAGWAPVK